MMQVKQRKMLPVRAALFACLLPLVGCDSTDPDDKIQDVVGEYTFVHFQFKPVSSAVIPVNVLDILDVATTRLQLFSNGRYTLLYQLQGSRTEFIDGTFTVRGSQINLTGRDADERFYRALLLKPEITLRRDAHMPNVLTASINRTINLAEFSAYYQGLTSVQGTVELRMERRP